ncbi:MAG TPA: VOC family protein [Candidatus Methylomirabilis sp.]|nr:VOC family protein [Candidatus Methylomirabilis sp.]
MLPPIHHLGYVVDDLHRDVPRFAAATGAGPFYAMEHIPFDEITYCGEPAVYDHSSAFGAWGPLIVELTQVHDAQPAGLRDSLASPGGGVGHVAWLADSLEDEVARLQRAGIIPFHAGRTGPASAVWLDGGELFGHPIEVLGRRDELLRFYSMVREASVGWGGTDPLRIMIGAPA